MVEQLMDHRRYLPPNIAKRLRQRKHWPKALKNGVKRQGMLFYNGKVFTSL